MRAVVLRPTYVVPSTIISATNAGCPLLLCATPSGDERDMLYSSVPANEGTLRTARANNRQHDAKRSKRISTTHAMTDDDAAATPVTIRAATKQDEPAMLEQFYRMWLDLGLEEGHLLPNWREITRQFIAEVSERLEYRGFVAVDESTERLVGSAHAQVFAGLYPAVIDPKHYKAGYIWGVYVEPSLRGRGVGKRLIEACNNYLHEIGCKQIVLHAAPAGNPVYVKLGFQGMRTIDGPGTD